MDEASPADDIMQDPIRKAHLEELMQHTVDAIEAFADKVEMSNIDMMTATLVIGVSCLEAGIQVLSGSERNQILRLINEVIEDLQEMREAREEDLYDKSYAQEELTTDPERSP